MKQRQDKHSDMYCLIVISAGCLSLLKQLLAQMFSTLARPSNWVSWKSTHPLLFAQFPVEGQSLLESVPTLERALCGVWESQLLHYAYLRWETLCVAVLCRNQTLFHCVFQQHYCVQNAVVQNFFKAGAFMQTTQPATEISREIWVWSIASQPRGWVYHPRAQCDVIVRMKTH